MLVIEQVSWRQPQYAVRDEAGHSGSCRRRRFGEAVTGEIDGTSFELRRDGRRRFTLVSSGALAATAEAPPRSPWKITCGGSVYQLQRSSRWRPGMELLHDETAVGSIRKRRALRGQLLCELPAELSPAIQAFIGFVVLTLWNRAAASSGSTVVATG